MKYIFQESKRIDVALSFDAAATRPDFGSRSRVVSGPFIVPEDLYFRPEPLHGMLSGHSNSVRALRPLHESIQLEQ